MAGLPQLVPAMPKRASAPAIARIALTQLALAFAIPSAASAWRDASLTSAYAQETPIRWQSGEFAIDLVDNGPMSFDEANDALATAVAAWSSSTCPSVAFALADRPAVAPSSGDSRVTVNWIVRGWASLGFAADAAASTEISYLRSPGSPWAIVDADIFLNAESATWSSVASPDGLQLSAVLAHEIGHALGLLHPCGVAGSEDVANGAALCLGEADTASLMYPTYGVAEPRLSPDDQSGLCALFAPDECALGGEGCPPMGTLLSGFACEEDAECASGACVDGLCVALCDETRGCGEFESCTVDASRTVCISRRLAFAAPCGRGDQCVSERCLTSDGDSYCTQLCDSSDCPSGFFCDAVDAMNVCRLIRPPPAEGCSVTAMEHKDLPFSWAALAVVALLGAARRTSRRRAAAGRVLLVIGASGLATGCGGTEPASVDAGGVDSPSADTGLTACDAVGETRVAACGRCGTRSEECVLGGWVARSGCLGEGECVAAAVETETTATCARRQRLCGTMCAWSDWDEIAPPTGVCEAGATRSARSSCLHGMIRPQTCGNDCGWEDSGECAWPCGAAPPASPHWDSEMLCVPGGPFMRGAPPAEFGKMEPFPNSLPLAEVRVSAFFVDRYPVTNRRYAACVDAGMCAAPPGDTTWRSAERAEFPVTNVSHASAGALCEFEGRRLPTAAEWEKSARGAAPDVRERPWETRGSAWDCDALPIQASPCFATTPGYALESVRSFPGSASPYGAELLIGGVREWVSDWIGNNYYAEATSRNDPMGPGTGVFREVRGESRTLVTAGTRLSTRYAISTTGLRCARSVI